jgi:hypothetical protein
MWEEVVVLEVIARGLVTRSSQGKCTLLLSAQVVREAQVEAALMDRPEQKAVIQFLIRSPAQVVVEDLAQGVTGQRALGLLVVRVVARPQMVQRLPAIRRLPLQRRVIRVVQVVELTRAVQAEVVLVVRDQ